MVQYFGGFKRMHSNHSGNSSGIIWGSHLWFSLKPLESCWDKQLQLNLLRSSAHLSYSALKYLCAEWQHQLLVLFIPCFGVSAVIHSQVELSIFTVCVCLAFAEPAEKQLPYVFAFSGKSWSSTDSYQTSRSDRTEKCFSRPFFHFAIRSILYQYFSETMAAYSRVQSVCVWRGGRVS